jgi:hypothetical protein
MMREVRTDERAATSDLRRMSAISGNVGVEVGERDPA